MRVQSSMVAMSLMAPMVQNPVFCTMAPKAMATRKADHSTWWVSDATSALVIRQF